MSASSGVLLLVALGSLLVVLYLTRAQLRELRDSFEEASETISGLLESVAKLEDAARAEELHGYAPARGRVHVARGRQARQEEDR